MTIQRRIFLALFLASGLLLYNQLFSADSARPAGIARWQGMETGVLSVQDARGATRELTVRIADEAAERHQGMQHLPPRTIRDHPIWFVYQRARHVGWHMQNVALALDIAFVDTNGRVMAVQRMEPGGSGYESPAPMRYALELAAGGAKRLGIVPGTKLSLQQ